MRDGNNGNGPEIFNRNQNKIFPAEEAKPKQKKKIEPAKKQTLQEMIEAARKREESQQDTCENLKRPESTTKEIILEAELQQAKSEIIDLKEKKGYLQKHYTVSTLNQDVLRMETGLPTKDVFHIVVNYTIRFKQSIDYFAGWRVESISFEDQIFITLMKVTTFIHVLHSILFTDLMTSIPSRDKNKLSAPSSFSQFGSCRVVIDCTDIEIATLGLMSQQNATYSNYRGMHSFKVIVGVAPNGVITYVSNLYPGSISDKAIVQQSGLLNHLTAGDMVLADKGFVIQDLVPNPNDVSVNIPPFLNNGSFTESEAKTTKAIAKCRIHVERANARLKDFKILSFIPYYLRCHADIIFQLCASLVNLQFPLIKESFEEYEFD